jgi:tetratricopeptide (TPR) repeat protein
MSEEPKAAMTLDLDMLAAYIDKRLPPEQRAEVEAQLASDPDAYAVLVESLKALDALDELDGEQRTVPFPVRKKSSKGWAIATAMLAAVAAVVLAVRLTSRLGSHPDLFISQVIDASGSARYFEGRLSGGFPYHPIQSVTRGPEQSSRETALRALVDSLQVEAQRDAAGEARHALGIAQLQLGDVDAAVATLDRITGDARSPAVRSDLAVALISRGRATGSTADFARASDEAGRAVKDNPALLEARFNYALALELSGSSTAREAWQDYLHRDTDPSSPWAAEARSHLQR